MVRVGPKVACGFSPVPTLGGIVFLVASNGRLTHSWTSSMERRTKGLRLEADRAVPWHRSLTRTSLTEDVVAMRVRFLVSWVSHSFGRRPKGHLRGPKQVQSKPGDAQW